MTDGLQISKETFERMDIDSKLNTLFDITVSIDQRLQNLENRKLFNTTLSAFTGAIGGFLAIIAKWVLKG